MTTLPTVISRAKGGNAATYLLHDPCDIEAQYRR
jgi:hypothetical protein